MKIETPSINWIDEFVCLRSKAYSFKCGDKNSNKLKGFSKPQSKILKFEGFKKWLDGEECQKECDNYTIKSIEHEMYLQKIKETFTFYFRW